MLTRREAEKPSILAPPVAQTPISAGEAKNLEDPRVTIAGQNLSDRYLEPQEGIPAPLERSDGASSAQTIKASRTWVREEAKVGATLRDRSCEPW